MQNFALTDFVELDEESPSLDLLDNDRIADLTGLTPKGILKSTGINRRYILKKGKSALDLAYEVAQKFLEKTEIGIENIGGVALVYTNYDKTRKVEQEIAYAIADRIGVNREFVTAISYGCAGFPKILSEAAQLMNRIGDDKHCLIITTETPSRMINARDPACTPIFADRAVATSMRRGAGHQLLFADTEDITPTGIKEGDNVFEIIEEEVFTFDRTIEKRIIFKMNKNLIFENGTRAIEEATRQSLSRVIQEHNIGNRRVIIVPHQPSGRMIRLLQEQVSPALQNEYENKMYGLNFVNGIDGMGNIISGTILSVLARLNTLLHEQPPQKGDIILIPAAGVCVNDPGKKMTIGRGALEWNPDGWKQSA